MLLSIDDATPNCQSPTLPRVWGFFASAPGIGSSGNRHNPNEVMEDDEGLRIDKFLWFTRLFASRSSAIQACQSGLVTIHSHPVKPSRIIQAGCVFEIRDESKVRTFRIEALPPQRVSASKVEQYMRNLDERPCPESQDSLRHFSRPVLPWSVPSRRGLKIISSFMA